MIKKNKDRRFYKKLIEITINFKNLINNYILKNKVDILKSWQKESYWLYSRYYLPV